MTRKPFYSFWFYRFALRASALFALSFALDTPVQIGRVKRGDYNFARWGEKYVKQRFFIAVWFDYGGRRWFYDAMTVDQALRTAVDSFLTAGAFADRRGPDADQGRTLVQALTESARPYQRYVCCGKCRSAMYSPEAWIALRAYGAQHRVTCRRCGHRLRLAPFVQMITVYRPSLFWGSGGA